MPGKPLLFDGAFGTYYYTLTGDESPCETANLTHPETVLQIHREYIAAGAQAIKTNTFALSPALIPDRDRLLETAAAGWRLACEAAEQTQVRVFADFGANDAQSAPADYEMLVEWYLGWGARNFLFETLSEFSALDPAIRLIKRRCPEATVIVSFAVTPDGYSRRGLHFRALLEQAWAHEGVDVAGLNCVCGPNHLLRLLGELPAPPKPFTAMPNAGFPTVINGRSIYEDNAEYYAHKLAEIYGTGADIVGGCCGSTPRHIALAAQALADAPARPSRAQARIWSASPASATGDSPLPTHKKLIAVEVDPPLDADCSFLLTASAEMKQGGADLVTIADAPLARARADSILCAAKVRREVGIEVLPHITCRDRNQNALKGALLGAAFEGISRVLVLTGDPPLQTDGRRPDGVFSFNSFDLISYIESLNRELFTEQPFLIAGALNVNAVNFGAELARARRKVTCGARLLLTQPIFSDVAVENFHRARRELDCGLLAGILPVAGYRNALFLQGEVSGIEIPASVIESLRDKSPEQAAEISVTYSAGIIRQVYDAADGFYIMTPLRKVEIVRSLIQLIREMEEHK